MTSSRSIHRCVECGRFFLVRSHDLGTTPCGNRLDFPLWDDRISVRVCEGTTEAYGNAELQRALNAADAIGGYESARMIISELNLAQGQKP